ncbi:MAG: MalY/PatB family protein [Promethearchaeota archaeon]
MKYDLGKVIDRTHTNSLKWDEIVLEKLFKSKDLLPLWVADMDFPCPKPVIAAIKKRAEHGIYGYSFHKLPSYNQAVADWMKRRHNWEIDFEWIVYSPGVVPAINMLIRTFTKTGEKVIIQPPVYHPFLSTVTNNGRILSLNQLKYENKRYKMDFEDLEEKAKDPLTKMLILCSPHNPVARVWTKEELTRLGEICLENNILVISDEIHQDLVLRGNKHTVFATISKKFEQNSIICTAPSKTFNIAGLQTSNIIIPNKILRDSFEHTIVGQNFLMLPNCFGIVALEAAYNEGEEWLEQVLQYIEENMDYIREFVKDKLPEIDFIEPEGTYLSWLDFRKLEMSGKELEEFMRTKAKVALSEGYTFGLGGEGFERINAGCPRSILEECMTRIEKAIRAADKKH